MSVKTDVSHKVNEKNRRGALIAIAEAKGISPCELVVNTVIEEDSIQGAAKILGVNSGTIRYWIDRAGKRIEYRTKLVLVDKDA